MGSAGILYANTGDGDTPSSWSIIKDSSGDALRWTIPSVNDSSILEPALFPGAGGCRVMLRSSSGYAWEAITEEDGCMGGWGGCRRGRI